MKRLIGIDYMTSVPRMDHCASFSPRLITTEDDLYYFQQSIGEGRPKTYFNDDAYLESISYLPKVKTKKKTIIRKK